MGAFDSNIILPVFELTEQHKETWRSDPESVWLAGLLEEIAELAQALEGKHDHSPEYELRQIASIALNWLDMRTNGTGKSQETQTG